MRLRMIGWGAGALILMSVAQPVPALAAACHGGASFSTWLEGVKSEARSRGISEATLNAAAPQMTFSQDIVNRDRGQRVFTQTFLEFSDRMVEQYRVGQGRQQLERHRDLFRRIEQQFGVPGAVLASFWGLETDFGANLGNIPTLRSVTSLAYDCRRPDKFRRELLAALAILERGDLTVDQMRGPWAGELGQMQFLPSHYYNHAVDFDGDGRRNLLASTADALASGAAYMAASGWRRGEPWLEEVRPPSDLPWDQAAISIRHPRSQWARWGVTRADGSALASDNLSASMILPMGRGGPAFLAYPNFHIFLEWNQSLVYATTAAYMATRLAGAPRVSRGAGVQPLSFEQVRELQQRLGQRGHNTGGVDGVIGAMTRNAVRAEQARLGLPADGYPTPELLQRLRQ